MLCLHVNAVNSEYQRLQINSLSTSLFLSSPSPFPSKYTCPKTPWQIPFDNVTSKPIAGAKLSIFFVYSFIKDGRPYLFHSFRNKYFNKISLGNMLYFQNKL